MLDCRYHYSYKFVGFSALALFGRFGTLGGSLLVLLATISNSDNYRSNTDSNEKFHTYSIIYWLKKKKTPVLSQ